MKVRRHLIEPTQELLSGFRAIVINGPRQSGKSTLVQQLQHGRGPVISLDDQAALNLARHDPVGFLDGLPPRVAIDEFQRGGEPLLLALKMRLDASDERGQYILAGSTRFLSMASLGETLTGRVGIKDLLPLSVGEVLGVTDDFVDRVFAESYYPSHTEPTRRDEYAELVARGGFPEMVLGPRNEPFRETWCQSYIDTVMGVANLEQVGDLRHPELMPTLLHQVSARLGGELVVADLARDLQASDKMTRSYLTMLETLYLVREMAGWAAGQTARAKRRPVAHVVDTALATHLLGQSAASLSEVGNTYFGPLLESFAIAEVAKQCTWAHKTTKMYHFRDRRQREIDLLLARGQQVVACEIKATATPLPKMARHMAYLRDQIGDRFVRGVLLHTGTQILPLGDRLIAVPISDLWAGTPND